MAKKRMTQDLIRIQKLIYDIRKQKVMLDRDLAELYVVELKAMIRLLSAILSVSRLILCFS
jgi:hypothetical protein